MRGRVDSNYPGQPIDSARHFLVMSCHAINDAYSLGISYVCAGVNIGKCMRINEKKKYTNRSKKLSKYNNVSIGNSLGK
jgi:hypothetical protein